MINQTVHFKRDDITAVYNVVAHRLHFMHINVAQEIVDYQRLCRKKNTFEAAQRRQTVAYNKRPFIEPESAGPKIPMFLLVCMHEFRLPCANCKTGTKANHSPCMEGT